MIDFKTITLPATMPLNERISEAARQIREWIYSYENGFDLRRDQLRLASFEEENGVHRYRYEFLRKESTSVHEENVAEL